MKISKDSFFSIGSDLKIPKEQIAAFWSKIEDQNESEITPFTKYLFYFGAMIVISALTWFVSLSWELFGGLGLFIIALSYILIFTGIGATYWNKKELRIPSGLLITIAVCLVPLAIYGLEVHFNIWPDENPGKYEDFYTWIKGGWVYMEVGTILAGLVALYYFPFPFLTAPIFFATWFLTMDIVPLVFGEDATWTKRYWISLCYGLALLVIAFVLDKKRKEDFSFWAYFFGALAFWGSLNCLMWDKGEGVLFLYLLVNLLMMCLAILLRRNVLMVLGAIGVFSYLSHLAYNIFQDTVLFPFIMSFIGLAIIYLGVLYQRNRKGIEKNLLDKLPSSFKDFLDK